MTKKALIEALARRRAARHEANPGTAAVSMTAKDSRLQSSEKPATK